MLPVQILTMLIDVHWYSQLVHTVEADRRVIGPHPAKGSAVGLPQALETTDVSVQNIPQRSLIIGRTLTYDFSPRCI